MKEKEGVIRIEGKFGEVVWKLPPDLAKFLMDSKKRELDLLKFLHPEGEDVEFLKKEFNNSVYNFFDREFTEMLKQYFHFFSSCLADPLIFLQINGEISQSLIDLTKKAIKIVSEELL